MVSGSSMDQNAATGKIQVYREKHCWIGVSMDYETGYGKREPDLWMCRASNQSM